MKTKTLFLLSALTCLGAGRLFATDDLPKPMAFARYNPMLDHSPFAVATAIAPPVVAPNFAKNLYISNAAHSPDGDLVTLQSTSDKNMHEYLTTKSTVHGYSIVNIEWSDRVGGTKVTISKDGQFATLGFNEALATQPLPNVPGQPTVAHQMIPQATVPQPVVPQPNQTKFPQAASQQFNQAKMAPAAGAAPSYPTPVPRVRGPIQRHAADSLRAAQSHEEKEIKEEK